MMTDEIIIALTAGTIFAGGFLLLSLCAFTVKVHMAQMKIVLEEAERRRRKAAINDAPPIEIS
jgi:hypothetical protein